MDFQTINWSIYFKKIQWKLPFSFQPLPLFSFGISIIAQKKKNTHTDDTKTTGRKKTHHVPPCSAAMWRHVAPSLFVCSSGGDASSIQSWSQFWTSGTQGLPSYWVDQLFGGSLCVLFLFPQKNNREWCTSGSFKTTFPKENIWYWCTVVVCGYIFRML